MEDDLITFQSDGKGGRHETKALLNDTDALWVEFRHQHIAKARVGSWSVRMLCNTFRLTNNTHHHTTQFRVRTGPRCLLQVMEQIGERTKEYIQANAGVELTRKLGTDAKMTPQELALIVKQLPVRACRLCLVHKRRASVASYLIARSPMPNNKQQEYREMTGKLWQHYSITTDVMARFQHYGVLDMSELEQTMCVSDRLREMASWGGLPFWASKMDRSRSHRGRDSVSSYLSPQPRATGVDADGKSAKEEKMLQSLEGMLQGLESTGMTLPNKMRLIAIFIISQVPTVIHHLRHDDPD